MTILTSQSTFTIGEASTETVSASVTILPAPGAGVGTGRLVHPTLGTYDYLYKPNEWTNMDGDAIIPPVWASSKTLIGAANTLFPGHLRDVVVDEIWTNDHMPIAMARMLCAMWMNPPDPASGYVQWYPSYINALGFKVMLVGMEVDGKTFVLDKYLSQIGWVKGKVVLKLRIAGRV